MAFRAALAIHEKLAADFLTMPEYRWGLAAARTNLGTVMKQEGKHDEAEAAYRAALGVLEKLADDFPAVPKYRENLAKTHNNLASVLDDQGKRVEAEAVCRAALPGREKLAADFPTVPEYRRGLAGSWINLGWILTGLDKHDEAEAAWCAALGILEKLAADFPTIPKYREELSVARQNLARAHLRKGDWDEAAAILSRAMEPDATDHFSAYQLGFLLAEQADLAAYQEYCHTMLSRWGNATDSKLAEQTAKACLLLAGGVSDPRQLAPLIQTAMSVGEKHEAYPWFLFAQGLHDYRCGRFAEARTACADSRQRAASHPELIVINQVVEAMSLYRLGKTDEARQALAAAGRLLYMTAPDPNDLGDGWENWLCCRILLREAEETMRTRWQAIELDPNDVNGHIDLGQIYARQGQWTEAAAAFERALEIDPANSDVWNLAAGARAALGGLEDFRRTCAQIVQRFGDATDKQTAERCAKACLLLPDALDAADFDRVQKLAERAVTGTQNHPLDYYFAMVKGLADYRAGRYAEAIKWTEAYAPRADGDHWDAIKFAVIAMAQCRLGDGDRALAEFDKANAIMAKMPDPAKGQLFGAGDWLDWVHAQVLCREAEAVLKKSTTETGSRIPLT